MLNIGLIGSTKILEPHVRRIQKNPKIDIIGKASFGSTSQLDSFHYSIPEFNRIELIERADIILMDDTSLMPFNLLCDIVKKSKHIFTTEYLKLSIDECSALVKLTSESGSVVQIKNPYFFTPAVQWLNDNLITPTFVEISHFIADLNDDILISLLLMLLKITGNNPKKINAVSYQSKESNSKFNNVHLEFSNSSVVNINYGMLNTIQEFKVKAFSSGQFVFFNFRNNTYHKNDKILNLSGYSSTNEFDTFINTIINKTPAISGIEDYLTVLQTIQKIDKKINQLST